MKWNPPPLFKFDVVPKLGACAWKAKGLRDHSWQKQRDSWVIWQPNGKIMGMLCIYCFLIWYADSIEALEKRGYSSDEIIAMFPNGADNKEMLKEMDKTRKWEREHVDFSSVVESI